MKNSTRCTCVTHRQRSDRTVRWLTTITVVLLAVIAAAVSYRHLHMLAVQHGETTWSASLLPLSVDGMILAASLSLLADSRRGKRGGLLPWLLLILGSLASVAANIAVAHPSAIGRVVAAWPAIALIGGLEMIFRQIRQAASRSVGDVSEHGGPPQPVDDEGSVTSIPRKQTRRGRALQQEAWQWALTHCQADGSLPHSADLARRFQRSTRWARLVKEHGTKGAYAAEPS